MVQSSGRFERVYMDGAYYSKAYGAISHFEIPLRGIKPRVIGHNEKKRYPYPGL
jgi:hypothetical protein